MQQTARRPNFPADRGGGAGRAPRPFDRRGPNFPPGARGPNFPLGAVRPRPGFSQPPRTRPDAPAPPRPTVAPGADVNVPGFEKPAPTVPQTPIRNPNTAAFQQTLSSYTPPINENIMDKFFPPLRVPQRQTPGQQPGAAVPLVRDLPPISRENIEKLLDRRCEGPTFNHPSLVVPQSLIMNFFEPCREPRLAPRFDPPPDVTAGGDALDEPSALLNVGRRPPF